MALLASEVQRIRYELGFNALGVGAEPYVGVSALFDQVIQPYLLAGAVTTSSTTVTASTAPASVTLTLTSATGFAQFATAIVDVDDAQESATVQAISGNTVTVRLSKAHAGTYPVTVEGGESIVRAFLRRLRDIGDRIERSAARAGIKSIDKGDVEFFGGNQMTRTAFDMLVQQQAYLRSELRRVLLGVGTGGGSQRLSVY